MKVTNEQIIKELKSIEKNLPKNDIYVSNINNNFRTMSYNQSVMRNDIKEIIRTCNDRSFGCGNK